MKRYVKFAQDKEILDNILGYIVDNKSLEDTLADAVEERTGGDVTRDEFHDWMGTFTLEDYKLQET